MVSPKFLKIDLTDVIHTEHHERWPTTESRQGQPLNQKDTLTYGYPGKKGVVYHYVGHRLINSNLPNVRAQHTTPAERGGRNCDRLFDEIPSAVTSWLRQTRSKPDILPRHIGLGPTESQSRQDL